MQNQKYSSHIHTPLAGLGGLQLFRFSQLEHKLCLHELLHLLLHALAFLFEALTDTVRRPEFFACHLNSPSIEAAFDLSLPFRCPMGKIRSLRSLTADAVPKTRPAAGLTLLSSTSRCYIE
jgi:hypothetical protein